MIKTSIFCSIKNCQLKCAGWLKNQYIFISRMHKIILLDGTSSSGKTTISRFFENDGYKYIGLDDYILVFDQQPHLINVRELMATDAVKHNKVIIDDVDQDILNLMDRKTVFIVIVYASLANLIRNMISRKETDHRGIFVFEQYAKKYIRSDTAEYSIDIINRKLFIENLIQIEYEFSSKHELINFANDIFLLMGIDNDENHFVKLRSTIQYDYIIDTNNKSPYDIYSELNKIIQYIY